MTIRTILAILLLLVGLGLVPWGRRDFDGAEVNFRKIGLGVLAASGLFFLLACIRVVDTGHVGIPVTFGSAGAPLDAGVALTNPFAQVREMSVRTESYSMTGGGEDGDDSITVQGSDGATGVADATILYRLDSTQASRVFREIGTGYEDRIVRPLARTCIRDAFVDYTMLNGATEDRDDVTLDIEECLDGGLSPRGLILESFQLRSVDVSPAVQEAIDARVAAQESRDRAEFELERTFIEAEQRRVEAQATADAEQIIVCGATTVVGEDGVTSVVPNEGAACEQNLTDQYLQLQYIQALEALVESGNTSTLILPFDQALTPLLNLGGPQ